VSGAGPLGIAGAPIALLTPITLFLSRVRVIGAAIGHAAVLVEFAVHARRRLVAHWRRRSRSAVREP
jgi:hypothetical protein